MCVQAARWRRQSRGQPALKWVRRGAWVLFGLEAMHVAVQCAKLDRMLRLYVGTVVNAGRPDALIQRLELAARWTFVWVGAAVLTGFTWRGYRITRKTCSKALLVCLWLAAGAMASMTLVLYAVALAEGPTIFSFASKIATCVFCWLCVTENVTLAAIFYKELLYDRLGTGSNDAVSDWAVQALAHQAPLILG